MHYICFKHITFMRKKHELMKNDFHAIFIIKSWDKKFMIRGLNLIVGGVYDLISKW